MRNKAQEIANGMLIFANYNHRIFSDYNGNPFVALKEDNDGIPSFLDPKDQPDDEKEILVKNNWVIDSGGWLYPLD